MARLPRISGISAVLFALPLALDAQSPLAAIEGHVVVEPGGPVRRARVILTGDGGHRLMVETDTDGRFRAEPLRDARYDVTAQKPGFVPAGDPVRIDLRDAASAGGASVRMQRAAAFEGRVHDTKGQPVINIAVTAERLSGECSVPGAECRLAEVYWEQTDDLGRYRVHTLPPGTYRLRVATPPRTGAPPLFHPNTSDAAEATVFRLEPGETRAALDFTVVPSVSGFNPVQAGAIEGRVVDELGEPVPGVTVQPLFTEGASDVLQPVTEMRAVGFTDDRGRFRLHNLGAGRYRLIGLTGLFGKSRTSPSSLKFDAPAGFAPTFFPGTADAAAAAIVDVAAGASVTADFALVPVPVTTLTGVVAAPGGERAGDVDVSLVPDVSAGPSLGNILAATAVAENGVYRFRGVPPGKFAVYTMGPQRAGGDRVVIPSSAGPQTIDAPFSLRGRTSITGRATFENHTGPLPLTYLFVTSVADARDPTVGVSYGGEVGPTGEFTLNPLALTGVIRADVRGWALQHVLIGGRDVTDEPYPFDGAPVSGVEIVLTRRVGALDGTVSGADTTPAVVLVFRPDELGVRASRFSRAARPDDQGAFVLDGLLPGRYFAIAMPVTTSINAPDQALLARLQSMATPIDITEAARTTVTLTLVRP